MKDQTIITCFGMALVVGFGALALWLGHDGIVIGSVLFIVGAGMGIVVPQPSFLHR